MDAQNQDAETIAAQDKTVNLCPNEHIFGVIYPPQNHCVIVQLPEVIEL